jgi:integrase
MSKRGNGEGSIFQRILKIKRKSKNILPECDNCKNCNNRSQCNNRENCNLCDICKNCNNFKTCDKYNISTKWTAQYTIGIKENGKSNIKVIYGKTRSEVKDKLNKALNEVCTGKFIDKSNIKLIDLIKNIREEKFKANIISPGQYARLKWTINKIENSSLENIKIQDLTKKNIQDFLNDNLGLSNSYLRKLYELINQACKKAQSEQIINLNPMDSVIRPKSTISDSEITSITIDEQKILSDYLFKSDIKNEPYKNIFLIQLFMGLRIGEVLALNIESVDLKNNILFIRKTLTRDIDFKVSMGTTTKTYAGKRDIPIPNFMVKLFEEQIEIAKLNSEALLFYDNGLVANTTMNTILKRIYNTTLNLKTNISTHILRHTYATRCIEAGMTPVVLQRLMGHTDIKVTLNTYTSIFNKFKQDEIEKVNAYFDKNKFGLL